jgi:hypothetical protein
MGTFIEINDTLQITREQGFPAELDFEKHKQKPFLASDFSDRVFEFRDKKDIRIYQVPPVRVFLAENIQGKWLYWGQCFVLETKLDMVNKTTSGKFKITKIFTPDEMRQAFKFLDSRPDFDFFQ